MDLLLPGRVSDPEDYEAQCALRTLLDAEKFRDTADEDLLSRVSEQIKYNISMLERVGSLVDGLKSEEEGEEAEEEEAVYDDSTEERTDTRSIEDFLRRANRARKEENRKNEMPLKGSRRYG